MHTPFHGEASVVAILILEAARAQGVYEEVLEAVLYKQPQWASHGNMRPELLLQIGERAGLNIEAALVHMQSASAMDALNQDREDVMTVGVKQTPTFFVNGKPVEPFGEATLRALVAAEVSAQK